MTGRGGDDPGRLLGVWVLVLLVLGAVVLGVGAGHLLGLYP